MSSVQELHDKAMNLAELAFIAKLKNDLVKASQLLQQALENESKAARLVTDETFSEPSRSILYRSAASLALDCNEFRESERLIAAGLAGNPPEEIAEELRDLLEKVNFQRHLDLRGISLTPEEVQMSIAGKSIGTGIAPSEEFIKRIEVAQKLVRRTVERMMDKPYHEGGAASGEVKDYKLFVSVPRAASFAVSLKVCGPRQMPIPFSEKDMKTLDSPQIIDEMLTCLDLFNQSEESKLQEKITQPAYYRNFIGLAKNIAPDGKEVNLVGFTVIRNGVKKKVGLTKSREEIQISFEGITDEEPERKKIPETITGKLLFADATCDTKRAIKIIDEKGKSHNIIVEEGMMSDIVKPLWEETVRVTGFRRRRDVVLEDIRKASTD